MKIVQQNVALNKPGSVTILIEEQDDIWLAYNIIAKGDTIITDTITRSIVHDEKKSPIRKNSSLDKINLEIKITDVDYEKDSSTLRVRGKTLAVNEVMASGSYHTVEIGKNKEFNLTKKKWNSDVIDTLHESQNSSSADLAVMILQRKSAQLFLVGHKTTLCAKIEAPNTNNKTTSNKYYEKIFQAFVKHVRFDKGVIRCVMIGSPGSMKEQFRGYLFQEAQRLKMKSIEANKSRFMVVNIGDKMTLEEIFNDGEMIESIKNTKTAVELIRAYKEFSDLLSMDSELACYGPKSVENANEMMAIDTLLITEDLVRSEDIALRKKHTELVKSVRKSGGKVFVFSGQSAVLTGIAAILRFPVADLDD